MTLVTHTGKSFGCQLLITRDRLLVLDTQTDSLLHVFLLIEHSLVEMEGERSTPSGWKRMHVCAASGQACRTDRLDYQHMLQQYLHVQPHADTETEPPATSSARAASSLTRSYRLELLLEEAQAHRLCYLFHYCREQLINSHNCFHCMPL